MLERYYALPTTVDRIRALWLGPAIERYATWLAERGFSVARGRGCIEVLIQFNRYALSHDAQDWNSLPELVDSFVSCRTRLRGRRRRDRRGRQTLRSMYRSPVEQLLRLVVPGYLGTSRRPSWPFSASVPKFPEYLRGERGLRWPTVQRYADHLRALERYFAKTGIAKLSELTPRLITGRPL